MDTPLIAKRNIRSRQASIGCFFAAFLIAFFSFWTISTRTLSDSEAPIGVGYNPANEITGNEACQVNDNNWITPCTCSGANQGNAQPVTCINAWPICTSSSEALGGPSDKIQAKRQKLERAGGRNICTRRCKDDSDCGDTLKCKGFFPKRDPPNGHPMILGFCLRAAEAATSKRNAFPVDFRQTEGQPEFQNANANNRDDYYTLLNVKLNTVGAAMNHAGQPLIPYGTLVVYVWGPHFNNPGHATVLARLGDEENGRTGYVSHWPGPSDNHPQFPRQEIVGPPGVVGEHKLPDVIYVIRNAGVNTAEFGNLAQTIRDSRYRFREENCSWAVRKILGISSLQVPEQRDIGGALPWTPWAIHNYCSAAMQNPSEAMTNANTQVLQFIRPDMLTSTWTAVFDRTTDPQIVNGVFNEVSRYGAWIGNAAVDAGQNVVNEASTALQNAADYCANYIANWMGGNNEPF